MESGHQSEEGVASVAVLLQVVVLTAVLALGHCLTRWRVTWIGDAGVALACGAAISAVLFAANAFEPFAPFLAFNKEFFFLALLPPIIFQAGYCLDTESFFANLGAISAFAFAGTAISTALVGLVLWLGGLAGACVQHSFLEALLFGSIVSATDPVTVLSVFERLHADANLHALVFGESVLNDAVAIVLFRVLASFLRTAVTVGAIFKAVGAFVGIFLGSMGIGAGIGFLVSFAVKTRFFRSEHLPLESCLVVLLAYCSYLLADALHLSGIVSVLFCGIVMSSYTKPNLSRVSRERTGAFFKVLSTLAETFVFVFVGASLFIQQQGWEHGRIASFVLVSLVALAISRAANIWPLAAAVNYLRTEDTRIPQSQQFMLWWAGLRGAMAFALALQAAEGLPGGRGEMMLSAVFFLIFITVVINGGSCAFLLSKLGLKANAGALAASLLPSPSTKYRRMDFSEDEIEGSAGLIRATGSPAPPNEAAATPPSSSPAMDLGMVGQVQGKLIAHSPSAGRLDRLREANKAGMLSKLTRLDERYLGRIFLADPERGLEMPEVVPAGDVDVGDSSHGPQHAPARSP